MPSAGSTPARSARSGSADAPRPILNLEPPYEGHIAYQSRELFDAYKVRRACYWSLLNAPTAGLTYGGHGLWSWQTEAGLPHDHHSTGIAKPWHEAIHLPGSTHMKHHGRPVHLTPLVAAPPG